MSEPPIVVRFDGVSKRYIIRRRDEERGTTMREELWALRDVSFELGRGEVFGIVGANGAGKSTLLKLLSRVTPPTTGWIGMNGRLTSLLEVGIGFHPELTGRENVFLNGVILGMRRAEVRRRFDQIVAFSGVERFLDVPVKRYSSGMYVRLAFAVAAHLDHEIMVVDEVLAVGDAAFRERCLACIEAAVAHEGRTVLFVSHDLSQIRRLAPRAMLLESGRINALGPTESVIQSYLAASLGPDIAAGAAGLDLHFETPDGARADALPSGSPFTMVLALGAVPPQAEIALTLEDAGGRPLWSGSSGLAEGELPLRVSVAALPLAPATYGLRVGYRVRGQLITERTHPLKLLAGSATSGEGPLALTVQWSRA